MGISHIKSLAQADFTGTVTVFNSVGSTVTMAGTDLARPSDWNSVHTLTQNFAGNTSGAASIGGTDLVWAGGNNITLSANGSTVSIHGAKQSLSYWENPRVDGMGSWSGTSNSISVQRMYVPENVIATRADIVLNISGSSSGSASIRLNLGIYTASQSTLNSASTTSRGLTFQSTSAISYTAVSGPRSWSIPLGAGWSMTPGDYFIAFNYGMTTGGSNTVFFNLYGNNTYVVSGFETGALANVTNVFRTGMINNNAQSTLPDTMQLSGMTATGQTAAQQPWVGWIGSF